MRNRDEITFMDNRGNAWNSEDLNELTIPEIEELGLHVAET